MPTKKSTKRRAQSAKRRVQSTTSATGRAASATSATQSASVDATIASLEAQMASIEEQIALLKEESRLRASDFRLQEEASHQASDSGLRASGGNVRPEVRSPKPEATPNSTATFLQTWLNELQIMFDNFSEIVPELGNTVLDTTERRRLLGSGVRRYGFIEKTVDVAEEFPQFWPSFVTETGELKERVDEIEVLRNLLVWFRYASRIVGDLLLVAGDDAFRLAGAYYATARDGARRKVPEAMQVFQLLQLFWKRPRRMTEEPTSDSGWSPTSNSGWSPAKHELERDSHALMRGKADGDIFAKHESPTPPVPRPNHAAGGVHEVMDHVQR